MYRQIDRQINRQIGRQLARQVGRQAGRQVGRHAGRQADRQVGRQLDRQIDRYIICHKYAGSFTATKLFLIKTFQKFSFAVFHGFVGICLNRPTCFKRLTTTTIFLSRAKVETLLVFLWQSSFEQEIIRMMEAANVSSI